MAWALILFDTEIGGAKGSGIDGEAPQKINLEISESKKEKKVYILGRGSPKFPVDVVLNARKTGNEIISRNHARIEVSHLGIVKIFDLKALNGVYVNRTRVESAVIGHGDVIQFGGVSNMPIGGQLSESDISIKYRCYFPSNKLGFGSPRSPRSEVKAAPKRRRSDDENSSNTSSSSKKKRSSSKDDRESKNKETLLEEAKAIQKKLAHIVAEENKKCSMDHTAQEFEWEISQLNKQMQKQQLVIEDFEKQFKLIHAAREKDQDEIGLLKQKLKKAEKSRSVSAEFCSISTGALRSVLQCPICSDPLFDACVTDCSHAFCEPCLSTHLSTNRKQQCPVCQESLSEGYVRSKHLDSAVLLLLESSSSEREAFEEREKELFKKNPSGTGSSFHNTMTRNGDLEGGSQGSYTSEAKDTEQSASQHSCY